MSRINKDREMAGEVVDRLGFIIDKGWHRIPSARLFVVPEDGQVLLVGHFLTSVAQFDLNNFAEGFDFMARAGLIDRIPIPWNT